MYDKLLLILIWNDVRLRYTGSSAPSYVLNLAKLKQLLLFFIFFFISMYVRSTQYRYSILRFVIHILFIILQDPNNLVKQVPGLSQIFVRNLGLLGIEGLYLVQDWTVTSCRWKIQMVQEVKNGHFENLHIVSRYVSN